MNIYRRRAGHQGTRDRRASKACLAPRWLGVFFAGEGHRRARGVPFLGKPGPPARALSSTQKMCQCGMQNGPWPAASRRLPALHFVPGWCVSVKPFAGVLPVCPRKVRLRLLQSLLWAVWPEVSDDPSRVSGQAFFKPCCSCLSVWTLIFSTTTRARAVRCENKSAGKVQLTLAHMNVASGAVRGIRMLKATDASMRLFDEWSSQEAPACSLRIRSWSELCYVQMFFCS